MHFLLMSGESQQARLTALVETTHSHGLRSSGLKKKPQVDVYPPGCPLLPIRIHSTHSYQLEFWGTSINHHREKCLTLEPLGGLRVVAFLW